MPQSPFEHRAELTGRELDPDNPSPRSLRLLSSSVAPNYLHNRHADLKISAAVQAMTGSSSNDENHVWPVSLLQMRELQKRERPERRVAGVSSVARGPS
jgi:hypothetical protein